MMMNNMETWEQQQRRKQPKHFWRPKMPQVGNWVQQGGMGGYELPRFNEIPRLSDLQQQNRAKTRKFFPKKKPQVPTPHAPRNTTSFIMRAKTSGGIAPPTPNTPAVMSTPDLSEAPYREGITEEVNKEWGVDGYGSMNGLIRLRAASEETGRNDESEEESDVDQGVESVKQLEERLDQDLNRFEIVYPDVTDKNRAILEGIRSESMESRVAHLEEENLTLKERIYILEQQVEELRQKLREHEVVDEMEVCNAASDQ